MIHAQELQGRWNQLQGKVKQKWGQLTDDDLRIAGGNVDQLIGRLQQKTGETRAAIEEYLDSLVDEAAPKMREAGEMLREGYEQVSEQARDVYDSATTFFQRRPAQSLAMVLTAGLVTGVLVGLACHSNE